MSDRSNADPRKKVYNSAAWRYGTRPAVLERDGYRCKCGAEATSVHHWPLSCLELMARGLDPLDPAYCVSRCAECHGREDARKKERKPNRFLSTVTRATR